MLLSKATYSAFKLYIFISMCVPWESNPQPFALLTQCSTTEPHRNTCSLITIKNNSIQCLAQGSHLSRGQFLPEPRFEPTTSCYKSNALSTRPRLLFLNLAGYSIKSHFKVNMKWKFAIPIYFLKSWSYFNWFVHSCVPFCFLTS